MNRRRVLFWLGACLTVAGLLTGMASAVGHRRARSEWVAESSRIGFGDPAYDAARSDRLYASALTWRAWGERAGWLTVFGMLLIALFGMSRSVPLDAEALRGRRAHVVALADGAISLLLLIAGAVDWLGPDLAAVGAFLSVALPGASLAYISGGLAGGLSLGARLTRTQVSGADGRLGSMRALAAVLLFPLGLAWAPIGLVLAPRSRPPHLLWTGLRTVRRAESRAVPTAGGQK